MGKTTITDLMESIFRHITYIHSILNKSNELKEAYVKTNCEDADEVRKLIKAAKKLIGYLDLRTTKLHTYFNTRCNSLGTFGRDSLNKIHVIKSTNKNEVVSIKPAIKKKSGTVDNANAPPNNDNSQIVSNSQVNQSNDIEHRLSNLCIEEHPKVVTVDASTQSTNCKHVAKGFLKCVDIRKLVNPSILPQLTTPKVASKKEDDPVFIIVESDSEHELSKTSSSKKRKRADNTVNARVLKGKMDNVSNNRNEPKSKKKRDAYVIISSDEDSDNVTDSEDDLAKEKRGPASIEKQILNFQSDKKFSYNAYVPLERVPCEKLKENYLKNRVRLRLANLNRLLKRCRSPVSLGKMEKEKCNAFDGSTSDSSAVSDVLPNIWTDGQAFNAVANKANSNKNQNDENVREEDFKSQYSLVLDTAEGDRQERVANKSVGPDKNKRNPPDIPKWTPFYDHDDRTEYQSSNKKGEGAENENHKKHFWSERWSHDRYNNVEQAPKSRSELVAIYGYNIRDQYDPPNSLWYRRYE